MKRSLKPLIFFFRILLMMPNMTEVSAATPVTADKVPAAMHDDALSRMFTWWNAAYREKDGFNDAAFRQFWIEDAELIIDGKVSAKGIADLTRHFRAIQARVPSVEIVLPFQMEFSSGNRIFTWHYIRSVVDGKVHCMQAMGYADVVDGKIALVHLTRTELKTAVPQCRADR